MKPVDAWQMRLGGTALLEASAGTGKTYTLTTLYLRLLVEQGLHPRDILVVTYTQAATAELRDRIRARIREAIVAGEAFARGEAAHPEDTEAVRLQALGERARGIARETGRADPLRNALQAFDEAAIFTIHGFCQRTLQENAFESGVAFDAELSAASAPVERALVHDLFHRLLAQESPGLVDWLLDGEGTIWRFEPDALHALLDRLGADEAMPVLPPPPENLPPIEAESKRLAERLREWARLWGERRETVARALLEDEGLNRTSYGQKKIGETWLPELDRLARAIDARVADDALAALALPKDLPKLTAAAVAAGAKKNAVPLEDPCFEVIGRIVAARDGLDEARNLRALSLRHRFVAAAREAARERREERHLLFFDDLLSELRAALIASPDDRLAKRLRQRFRFALIDEFQDTDPVQYEIFRRVWHEQAPAARSSAASDGRGLVLIGDPKQAIYSFRGADVFTYLAAHADAGSAVFGLQTNWRSDPGLIGAVNALFEGRRDAFALDTIEFHPVHAREAVPERFLAGDHPGAAFRVLLAGREGAQEGELSRDGSWPIRFGRTRFAQAVAADIAALLSSSATLDGRPIEPSDVAVLCRRKLELGYMRRALEGLGIPCVDRGDDDVFESREAWELCCVLEAMIRPGDPGRLRAALATGAHALDAEAIAALDDDGGALAEISDRYAEYGRLWSRLGFARAFETWRRNEGVTATMLAYRDGDRRLTNWLHLAELLQRRASEQGASRQGLVAWLLRAIAAPEARGALGEEASLLRLERDDEAVSLVTLHRSKGLEYPIVYLPSLWEDVGGKASRSARKPKKDERLELRGEPVRFHDAGRGARTLDLSGHRDYPDHVDQSQAESFSEQLRLLYVGLTRARHQCVVGWGAIGQGWARTPLAWLLHGVGADGEEPDRATTAGIVKAYDDTQWREAWERLASRRADASIAVETARLGPAPRWSRRAASRRALVPPAVRRPLPEALRTTSFTAMVREGARAPEAVSPTVLIGRDVDLAEPTPSSSEPEAPPEGGDLVNGMDAFPRGAAVGTLLHEVLEQVDFSDPSFLGPAPADGSPRGPETLAEVALRALARGALGGELLDVVLRMVEAVATTPLGVEPDALRLSSLAPGALRPEMEFTLAAPGAPRPEMEFTLAAPGAPRPDVELSLAAPEQARGLDPAHLGRVLADAARGSPVARYAERAARLGFPPLEGFVRGFIDAVFFDGERYFLVDYKSNHLGASQRDYAPDALVAPMIEHDYVLQYLLYAVALDRHLGRRLEGYDYARHFGGVYYLFLRGLSADHLPGCGVFFDRPDQAIVRALSRSIGGSTEVGA